MVYSLSSRPSVSTILLKDLRRRLYNLGLDLLLFLFSAVQGALVQDNQDRIYGGGGPLVVTKEGGREGPINGRVGGTTETKGLRM